MLFNVPQFIDIEDKIVGPLTAKQLGWLSLGGVILMIFWNFLDTQAFIIAAVIVGIICGALAFARPYNQSLISFIFSSVTFIIRPKMYVWKRIAETFRRKKGYSDSQDKKAITESKKIDVRKIEEISKRLDNKQ